jgi:septal ring factor EnvC (AmiA/AmiB activator)
MDTEKDEKVAAESEIIDSLQRENEALADEIKSRDTAMLKLEAVLKAKESEISGLKNERDGLKQALDEAGKSLARAVAAYKEMVIQSNPGLPAELITGDTIDAVKESVKNARAIVEKVRQEMEAEAAKTRVPAGSPPRAPVDFSGLSAREKIQHGLGSS